MKAKTVCEVRLPVYGPPIPPPPPPVTTGIGKPFCPSRPTVGSCPAGQIKYVTFSSPDCGAYYGCRDEKSGYPGYSPGPSGSYSPGPYPMYSTYPIGTHAPSPSCPPGSYWDYHIGGCDYHSGSYSPLPPGGSYTPYPSPVTCPAGQWWDYATNSCKPMSGSYSPAPSYSPYPSSSPISGGSCPTGSHSMGGYCMSDIDTTKCGSYGSTSVSSFVSCSTFGTATMPSYTPYPSSSVSPGISYTPTPSCPAGQWWDTVMSKCTSTTSPCAAGYYWDSVSNICKPTSTTSYTPYPSPGTCPAGQTWYWPPSGAGYCQTTPTYTPYTSPSASYTPYPTVSGGTPYPTYSPSVTATPYPSYSSAPSYSYTPYPTYSTAPTYTPAPTPPPSTPAPTPYPTYSTMPSMAPCPAGQVWNEATRSCKVAAGFDYRAHQLAVAITVCRDSGGNWNTTKGTCQQSLTDYFFGGIFRIFSRLIGP